MAVGVRLVRSGDRGTTRGEGPGRPIIVDLIALDTPVTPGESVVTSGLQGSRYPEGLLVGTVSAAHPEPIADRQVVEVAPVASPDNLRFATVILYEPEPLPTTTTVPTTTTTVPDDATSTTAGDGTGVDDTAPATSVDGTAPATSVDGGSPVPDGGQPGASDVRTSSGGDTTGGDEPATITSVTDPDQAP